ncbi:hypothetical protein SEA_DEJAVU_20 [Microbacterium Phage DejaVu]|nr:hypothetical protein SEA_DEJAVU_20 [Microbacterium Phage DejaVu]
MAKQKYTWGWASFFVEGGEPCDEGEGYLSKAEVLQDVQKMRAEEKESLKNGFQTKETLIKFVVRRQPVYVIPEWEVVPG